MDRLVSRSHRLPRFASLVLGLFLVAKPVMGEGPAAVAERLPIPTKLAVLTFDDSVRSHFEVVRPILLKYGFGATFFITEGFDFKTNKRDYMTWDEIAQLHRDGFEIGNHTRDHLGLSDERADQAEEQLSAIRQRCRDHGIPDPVSFAWPGNAFSAKAFETLRRQGIRFARRGGGPEYPYEKGAGVGYEPLVDHPLLIPSAADARPAWEFEDFRREVQRNSGAGRIVVLQFHGVPDTAHPWVNTSPDKFEMYMNHLAREKYTVIAMRDLEKYVDPDVMTNDPMGVIRDRQARIAAGKPLVQGRMPKGEADLKFWLTTMAKDHAYTLAEMQAATGMGETELVESLRRLGLRSRDGQGANEVAADEAAPDKASAGVAGGAGTKLKVVPYPGGRHPRIGFRDGALRPQRETKLSLFLPWDQGGYVVADFPEAIWWEPTSGRELLYLAHTHVPTVWDKRGVELEPLEWEATEDGWKIERRLPNGVTFRTRAYPGERDCRFEMEIENGTQETLRGVVVQNCVMLARAPGFENQTAENKSIRDPIVACRHVDGDGWVITAWQGCQRPWANPPCPCIHSDPKFPDCPPGESRKLVGYVSFYRGDRVEDEFARVEGLVRGEAARQ
jgi:peptidoglycan/xylan/chitin deacetylase (PgdA/CDA1 family)